MHRSLLSSARSQPHNTKSSAAPRAHRALAQSAYVSDADRDAEATVRPRRLAEFIAQDRVRDQLDLFWNRVLSGFQDAAEQDRPATSDQHEEQR